MHVGLDKEFERAFGAAEKDLHLFELPSEFAAGVERHLHAAHFAGRNGLSLIVERRAAATAAGRDDDQRFAGLVFEAELFHGDFARSETSEPDGIRTAVDKHRVRDGDDLPLSGGRLFRGGPVQVPARRKSGQQDNCRQGISEESSQGSHMGLYRVSVGFFRNRVVPVSGLYRIRAGLFRIHVVPVSDLCWIRVVLSSGLYRVRVVLLSGLRSDWHQIGPGSDQTATGLFDAALFGERCDDLVEHAVDEGAAAGGGVELRDLDPLVEGHLDGDRREGGELGDGRSEDEVVHEDDPLDIPVRGKLLDVVLIGVEVDQGLFEEGLDEFGILLALELGRDADFGMGGSQAGERSEDHHDDEGQVVAPEDGDLLEGVVESVAVL